MDINVTKRVRKKGSEELFNNQKRKRDRRDYLVTNVMIF